MVTRIWILFLRFIYSAVFFSYSVFFIYIRMRLELFMTKYAIIKYVVGFPSPLETDYSAVGGGTPTIFEDKKSTVWGC